jgi:hypothetical protein
MAVALFGKTFIESTVFTKLWSYSKDILGNVIKIFVYEENYFQESAAI